MEVRFYTPTLYLTGIMENQTSLIWTRRYFEPGEFELHAPVTDSNLAMTARGNIIWKKDSVEAGVIEDRTLDEGTSAGEITIKGRFLSSYFDRRLIKSTVYFSGTYEAAMRQLVSGVTAIPLVTLGDEAGFTDTVSFQVTYKNLLTYIEKLSSASGLGFRLRPDFDAKVLYFEVYEGTDRTASQGVTSRVIFSASYANLNNVIYRENDQLYKNVAYVGGEGEGSERVYVTVGDTDAEGLELREVFVDAKDIVSDDLTEDEYTESLEQRGWEALEEDILSESLECDTGADANFTYKTDYDLGDIVTVRKPAWGIEEDLRITEVQEVYESEYRTILPTFGDPLPETIDWDDD